jgi:ribosome-associated protein
VKDLIVNPGLTIPAAELEWAAARSSGPGGQNVNKVSTKVELHFDFEQSGVLAPSVKNRLRTLAKGKLDATGRLLVTSQLTRDQSRNLEDARAKLAELVARASIVPKRRRPTRPSRASPRARLDQKRLHSEKKRARTERADKG